MDEILEADTFKILLATDIHLGYGEQIPNRENDTFVTFEEVLDIANKEKVDFILLGGDLFHETKPSNYCIQKCIELIRKYCLGDRSVEIEVLSDPSVNFHRNATVNYEDPNMNISIPIFSIHGNHDDPAGKRRTSALDLLASIGLVNYFGRWDDVAQVEVNPVLLKKGETLLALYGLSHIRDERLGRLFLNNKVKMKVPPNVDDWFNILILHQNRAKNRGAKNFIPETCIPPFVDLAFWGHEHDCRIEPVCLLDSKTYVTQPGSTVATSLTDGEALRKKVGLLRVNGQKFNITPIELTTVRPFIHGNLTLDPIPVVHGKVPLSERAKQQIKVKMEQMINEAKEYGRASHILPLIRLIVHYHDELQLFNAIRFGQEFGERIANPDDAIKFVSLNKKTRYRGTGAGLEFDDEGEIDEEIHRVEDLIPTYFNEQNKLKVLNLAGLNEAVKRCIDASDADAPSFITDNQEEYLLKKLIELQPNENELEECFAHLQEGRNLDEFKRLLNDPNRKNKRDDNVMTIDDSDDETSPTVTPVKPATGRGSRGGSASRRSRGQRGVRGRAKN